MRQIDLHRPAERRCGWWSTSPSRFSGIVVRRYWGDDGARAIGAAADVGFAWSGRRRWCRRRSSAASHRVIDNDRQILQHRQWGALPRSLSAAAAAALKDQRNLAALTPLAALTRAQNSKNKAAADQPPRLELFYKEYRSNGRLRVGNWIMQGLYDYAVKCTVELSLLTAFQHVADPTRVGTVAD